ncbi:hypothetical protein PORY_002744 [Pneumocystis oryctolagi]|uniref:Uncharacterized protein n=1 Tax=Pneumocystis oryctolagi TaxID=42067 RepID=A0ACB7C897_9ASCO|nr:hypothetical protein PORY_002744 [Pneumocystis oryctolagi]
MSFQGECQAIMKLYMQCLESNQYKQSACKEAAKAYLQCRMDFALFEPRKMHDLGFHETHSEQRENKD